MWRACSDADADSREDSTVGLAAVVAAVTVMRWCLLAEAVRPPEQGEGMCAKADFISISISLALCTGGVMAEDEEEGDRERLPSVCVCVCSSVAGCEPVVLGCVVVDGEDRSLSGKVGRRLGRGNGACASDLDGEELTVFEEPEGRMEAAVLVVDLGSGRCKYTAAVSFAPPPPPLPPPPLHEEFMWPAFLLVRIEKQPEISRQVKSEGVDPEEELVEGAPEGTF